MSDAPMIGVEPVYGWGWVIDGAGRFEVPGPFAMQLDGVEPGRWCGVVQDKGHEFQGRRVALSQRHREWTGIVNIVVEAAEAGAPPSAGFGKVAGDLPGMARGHPPEGGLTPPDNPARAGSPG